MIEYNLFTPYDDFPVIRDMADDHFVIRWSNKERNKELRFYVIETTEEMATLLSLKYGTKMIWKR